MELIHRIIPFQKYFELCVSNMTDLKTLCERINIFNCETVFFLAEQEMLPVAGFFWRNTLDERITSSRTHCKSKPFHLKQLRVKNFTSRKKYISCKDRNI